MMETTTNSVCEECLGERGHYEYVQYYVTRDMAIDAGDIRMQGMELDEEEVWADCDFCEGTGYQPIDDPDCLPLINPEELEAYLRAARIDIWDLGVRTIPPADDEELEGYLRAARINRGFNES